MQPECSLSYSQEPISPTPCVTLCNVLVSYNEELLARRSTPELEDHPLWAVRDYLFNAFEVRSYPCDLPATGSRSTRY
jgi:hypothetical protein